MSHSLSRTVCLVTALVVAAASPVLAQVPACTGRNLLDEMKSSNTAAYDAIRTEADATPSNKTLLWKIENTAKIARPPSYVFGTIHVTDDRVHKLTPAVQEAFSSVQRVIVEIADANRGRVTEGLTTLRNTGKLLLPEQKRLENLLTPNEQQAALKALSRTGLSADIAARVQPWAVLALLGSSDCERVRLRAGKRPLDGEIARRAEARGMGTADIETVEMQFDSMARVPQEAQLSLLKGQIAVDAQLPDMIETMVQLYLARDIGALWPLQVALSKQAGVDDAAVAAYHEHVLAARTNRMALRMSSHLDRGGVFVAVGAMHLPGKTGLVQRLRDMNYKLTAIE